MEGPADISGIQMVEVKTPSIWIPVGIIGGTVLFVLLALMLV